MIIELAHDENVFVDVNDEPEARTSFREDPCDLDDHRSREAMV
jgi:hypothetical protein